MPVSQDFQRHSFGENQRIYKWRELYKKALNFTYVGDKVKATGYSGVDTWCVKMSKL